MTSMDSMNQWVGGCCQSESDPANCFSDDMKDGSKSCQKAIQQRCQSGISGIAGPVCHHQAWLHDQRGYHVKVMKGTKALLQQGKSPILSYPLQNFLHVGWDIAILCWLSKASTVIKTVYITIVVLSLLVVSSSFGYLGVIAVVLSLFLV